MPRRFVPGRGAGKIRVRRETPSSRMVTGHVQTGPSSPWPKAKQISALSEWPLCLNRSGEVTRSEGSGWGEGGSCSAALSSSHTPNTLAFTPAQAGKKSSVQTMAGTEKRFD